ncbi:hypothetical protein L1887_27599 [Cichorium endivia]|nr:hypothetical protein L1887_27599 [Cichorium endivia]
MIVVCSLLHLGCPTFLAALVTRPVFVPIFFYTIFAYLTFNTLLQLTVHPKYPKRGERKKERLCNKGCICVLYD